MFNFKYIKKDIKTTVTTVTNLIYSELNCNTNCNGVTVVTVKKIYRYIKSLN